MQFAVEVVTLETGGERGGKGFSNKVNWFKTLKVSTNV